jgi:hypothetical protein
MAEFQKSAASMKVWRSIADISADISKWINDAAWLVLTQATAKIVENKHLMKSRILDSRLGASIRQFGLKEGRRSADPVGRRSTLLIVPPPS